MIRLKIVESHVDNRFKLLPEAFMHYIVRCPVPDDVARKQIDLALAIRTNPQKGVHVERMLDATLVMADELLNFFFMRPLETARVGAMTKGAVSMGIRTGMGIISKLAKRAFAGMERDQLLLFADYLDSLISSEE